MVDHEFHYNVRSAAHKLDTAGEDLSEALNFRIVFNIRVPEMRPSLDRTGLARGPVASLAYKLRSVIGLAIQKENAAPTAKVSPLEPGRYIGRHDAQMITRGIGQTAVKTRVPTDGLKSRDLGQFCGRSQCTGVDVTSGLQAFTYIETIIGPDLRERGDTILCTPVVPVWFGSTAPGWRHDFTKEHGPDGDLPAVGGSIVEDTTLFR